MADRKPPPRNAGQPWSDEEDDAIRRMETEGHDAKAIAEALGRTRFGIEMRLVKLGLRKLAGCA